MNTPFRRRCRSWRAPVIAMIMLLAAPPAPARAADPNEFLVWSDPNLPGRLFVPPNYDPARAYPLILYLHGFGLRGTDNVSQVNASIDGVLAVAKQREAFLYAPQSPSGGWASTAPDPTAEIQRAMAMIGAADDVYPIDANRLYVTGFSAGGGGAWDTLAKHPGTFAAGIPICGTGGALLYRDTLGDENIWTFHARNDPTVPVSTTRDMVNAIFTGEGFDAVTFPPLGSAGAAYYVNGRLQYYELDSGGHDIWRYLYQQPVLYDWMFAQSLPEPGGAMAACAACVTGYLRRRRCVDGAAR